MLISGNTIFTIVISESFQKMLIISVDHIVNNLIPVVNCMAITGKNFYTAIFAVCARNLLKQNPPIFGKLGARKLCLLSDNYILLLVYTSTLNFLSYYKLA